MARKKSHKPVIRLVGLSSSSRGGVQDLQSRELSVSTLDELLTRAGTQPLSPDDIASLRSASNTLARLTGGARARPRLAQAATADAGAQYRVPQEHPQAARRGQSPTHLALGGHRGGQRQGHRKGWWRAASREGIRASPRPRTQWRGRLHGSQTAASPSPGAQAGGVLRAVRKGEAVPRVSAQPLRAGAGDGAAGGHRRGAGGPALQPLRGPA